MNAKLFALMALIAVAAAQTFSTGPYQPPNNDNGGGNDPTAVAIPVVSGACPVAGTIGGATTAANLVTANGNVLLQGYSFTANSGMTMSAGASLNSQTKAVTIKGDFQGAGGNSANPNYQFNAASGYTASVSVTGNMAYTAGAKVLFSTGATVNVGGKLSFDTTCQVTFQAIALGANDGEILMQVGSIDFGNASITVRGPIAAGMIVVRSTTDIANGGNVGAVTLQNTMARGGRGLLQTSGLTLVCSGRSCAIGSPNAGTTLADSTTSAAASVQPMLAALFAALCALLVVLA